MGELRPSDRFSGKDGCARVGSCRRRKRLCLFSGDRARREWLVKSLGLRCFYVQLWFLAARGSDIFILGLAVQSFSICQRHACRFEEGHHHSTRARIFNAPHWLERHSYYNQWRERWESLRGLAGRSADLQSHALGRRSELPCAAVHARPLPGHLGLRCLVDNMPSRHLL